MQIQFGSCLLELSQGDIVQQPTDAIVNATDADLAAVDGGAVHDHGGPGIVEEIKRHYPDGCEVGNAVATMAGDLPCRCVFHAVGPVWGGGRKEEKNALQSAYRSCLRLAIQYRCDSIAFPAISTGTFGYPADLAASHSLEAVRDFLIERKAPGQVRFVLATEGMYGAYARALDELIA